MRQYYDVYSLLSDKAVQEFIGTKEYLEHKEKRFPSDGFTIPVTKNESFLLNDTAIRKRLQKRYEGTKALYYKGQAPFENILKRIQDYIDKL